MKAVEKFKDVKNQLFFLAQWLKNEEILSDEDYIDLLEILAKSKIKLGVAGQMKYGKSTLINALLFKRKVLPTSDVPMTATLTFIEYGDNEEYEVEFYSVEEWENIKAVAKSEGDNPEIIACKTILEEALKNFGDSLNNFLGKRVKVSKENLEDYVGAEGKYTPITKALHIRYPSEVLKELTLVDTPGFNDPIVSREKEAEKFLKEADALIFVLYAGRTLDATDKFLLTQKIAEVGIGHVILALNKYDYLLEEVGSLEKVEDYLQKVRQDIINDESLGKTIRDIIKEAPIIKTSGLWALLGAMPEEEMDENDKWYFDKFKREFPLLKTKEDFIKYSGLPDLEEELLRIVNEKKINILVNKFKSVLESKINEHITKITSEIFSLESEEELLHNGKEEISRKKEEFEHFKKYIYPNILKYGDILNEIDGLVNNYKRTLLKFVDNRFNSISFDVGFLDRINYSSKIKEILYETSLEVKLEIDEKLFNLLQKEIKPKIKDYIENTIESLLENDIVRKYTRLTPSIEQDLKAKILDILDTQVSIENVSIDSLQIGIIERFFNPSEVKRKAKEYANKVADNIKENVNHILDSYRRDIVNFFMKVIKEEIDKSVINPIEQSIERAEEGLRDRETRLKEIIDQISKLKKEKEKLEEIKKEFESKISKIGGG